MVYLPITWYNFFISWYEESAQNSHRMEIQDRIILETHGILNYDINSQPPKPALRPDSQSSGAISRQQTNHPGQP